MRRLLLMALLSVAATHAFAQNYPTKPVQMIIPHPPGGGNDTLGTRAFKETVARSVAQG